MKSIKLIALSSIFAIGTFGTVLYTSCTKDECKGVTCQNTGTCSGGNCTCPAGVTGTSCETVYDVAYAGTYVGSGTDNATPSNTYTDFHFIFAIPGSATGFTTMTCTVQDNTGASVDVPILNLTLTGFSSSGANFSTTAAQTNGSYSYTATGTISATASSITITETPTAGGTPTVYTFSNCQRQ